jgi:hypothetical protein
MRLYLVTALSMFGVVSLDAQTGHTPSLIARVPVTVVAASTPKDSGVIIRRVAGNAPQDLLILPRGADAGDLLRGLATLGRVRAMLGDSATRNSTIRLAAGLPNRQQKTSNPQWAQATATLTRLHQQPTQEVRGVGAVQSVQLYLPASRR